MQHCERADAVLLLAKILCRGLAFTLKLLTAFIENKPIPGM